MPGFSLLKQTGPAVAGPWSSSTTVQPGANVYYKFTLVNTGGVDLSPVSVTDIIPAVDTLAAGCAFSDPLAVGAATICVTGPIVASVTPAPIRTPQPAAVRRPPGM